MARHPTEMDKWRIQASGVSMLREAANGHPRAISTQAAREQLANMDRGYQDERKRKQINRLLEAIEKLGS